MRLIILMLFCLAGSARAQTFDLSIKNIMRGPELVGAPPQNVQFSDDDKWVFFRWKPGGRPWHEALALYRVPARGGVPEKLSEEQADSLGVLLAPGTMSEDERWRAVAYNGDLYLINRRTLAVRRLTRTRATETSPVLSPDARTLYFLRDNNVFALSTSDGGLTQLTDIRMGPAPRDRTFSSTTRRT